MDRVTSQLSPRLTSSYVFLLSTLWMLPLAGELTHLSSGSWSLGLLLGVAAAIANVAFLDLLHRLGSTRISVVSLLQRPFTIVLAALILQESVSAGQWMGVALVVLGVWLAGQGIQRAD